MFYPVEFVILSMLYLRLRFEHRVLLVIYFAYSLLIALSSLSYTMYLLFNGVILYTFLVLACYAVRQHRFKAWLVNILPILVFKSIELWFVVSPLRVPSIILHYATFFIFNNDESIYLFLIVSIGWHAIKPHLLHEKDWLSWSIFILTTLNFIVLY